MRTAYGRKEVEGSQADAVHLSRHLSATADHAVNGSTIASVDHCHDGV